MPLSNVACDLDDFPLDVFGQQPRINRIYTQITFCFPIIDEQPELPIEATIRTLQDGVERLSTSFPWTAGKVVQEHGLYKIRAREGSLSIVIKELRHHDSMPSWDILQKASFPFSMLDECTIAPVKTLSEEAGPELLVFLVQANIISGGLLITFNGQHGSMDMAGLGEVIRLLAKACRNEPFTTSELAVGNMRRDNIFCLIGKDDLSGGEGDSTGNSVDERVAPQIEIPSCSWAYFLFSASSMRALKSEAMSTIPTSDFVSTDDVLSVFVWQSITRARLRRLGVGSDLTSTLSRNVNVRRYLDVAPGYPGVITHSTTHSISIDTLVEKSLGSLAVDLRSALDPKVIAEETRASALHIMKGGAAKATFASTSTPELDVRLSSWAKEKCYEVEFGFAAGTGKLEAVRRPRFMDGAREGLVYLLPKALDGEIAVGICLRDADLEILKTDEVFVKYATYIG
jgi:trichothecene 3-O-acetyltransferase